MALLEGRSQGLAGTSQAPRGCVGLNQMSPIVRHLNTWTPFDCAGQWGLGGCNLLEKECHCRVVFEFETVDIPSLLSASCSGLEMGALSCSAVISSTVMFYFSEAVSPNTPFLP